MTFLPESSCPESSWPESSCPERSWGLGKAKTTGRRGLVLVVVLVVVAFLALGGYTFSNLTLTERRAAHTTGRGIQARALADSGVEFLQAILSEDPQLRRENGGLYDNAVRFQGVLVIDSDLPRGRGRFAVVAPQTDDNGNLAGIRYGLEDESTRLNLNTLLLAEEYEEDGGRTLLLGLPGMTVDVADAILDWLDPDDQQREFGAEIDYYSGLNPPYAPSNGPLKTVEELLLVRGITPALLFGSDANRNGTIDATEAASGVVGGVDNADGSLDRGWSAYLTLSSVESNRRPDGTPKINLNSEDMEQLHDQLSEVFEPAWANFIVAYRQNGPYTGSKQGEPPDSGTPDLSRPARIPLTSVLDLIGTRVRARLEGERESTVLESPFPPLPVAMRLYLPVLLDQVAANPAAQIPGRININQASRAVLRGIPGIEEEIVEQIIANRQPEIPEDQPSRRHETWLLTEEIVDLTQMRAIYPFITSGGDAYRAQVIGYFEEGGPAARLEVVIDASGPVPRVVSWRDLSHLGRGYAVETLGIGGGDQDL